MTSVIWITDVANTVRDALRSSFPLWEESHAVRACHREDRKIWAGYFAFDDDFRRHETHFDLNLIGDVCYLLSIQLAPEQRGKGHGWALYQAIEQAARELGCSRVEMTASGWTVRCETRAKWLERRGYSLRGNVAWKDLQ